MFRVEVFFLRGRAGVHTPTARFTPVFLFFRRYDWVYGRTLLLDLSESESVVLSTNLGTLSLGWLCLEGWVRYLDWCWNRIYTLQGSCA